MYIQSYQIHNVLNVYRRQLSQTNPDPVHHSAGCKDKSDPVRISAEGKNQSIMQKVADNVLKKITNVDPETGFQQEMTKQVKQTLKDRQMVEKENTFVFHTIGGNNQMETRSIAVDNSQVLMNRLNELAKAAVNRKAE
jgi:hypothetical protein